ncbi:MAG: recombinase RecA [Chlamydiia bacterium]|nr:recombinase RecA [Chlamydiia bacterium]
MEENKKSILDKVVASIKKDFDKCAIMTLNESLLSRHDECTPTGCISIDLAIGGGIPKGRIVEIFGPESSGKTTLAISIIKQAQLRGGSVAFIDVEHAFDPIYAKAIGVNPDTLHVSQPDSGDDALNIADRLAASGVIDVIVVDSVAALVPKQELNGNVGDSFMGLQARMIAQSIRKIVPVINKNGCSLIFINQIREKIGVVFGSPEVTPGGRALKFAASIRIEIRKAGNIKKDDADIGIKSRIKIVKNKLFPPFKITECEIFFGEGVSQESAIIDQAVSFGILKKKGSWISLEDENIAQGKENLREILKKNTDLRDKLMTAILAKAKVKSEENTKVKV